MAYNSVCSWRTDPYHLQVTKTQIRSAFAQSDQALHSLLLESLDTLEYINELWCVDQRASMQADLGIHCLNMQCKPFTHISCYINTILWANSADDNLIKFFLFFWENRTWHFMQIVSSGDNLHEMSNPIF